MLRYVENKSMCRQLMIQQYFGEKASEPCGRCDVCIGRFKSKVADSEFESIKKAVVAFIQAKTPRYRDVLAECRVGSPAQREKVLRYLLDQKVILSDEFGVLSVAPK